MFGGFKRKPKGKTTSCFVSFFWGGVPIPTSFHRLVFGAPVVQMGFMPHLPRDTEALTLGMSAENVED